MPVRPSENEEQYFAEREKERISALRAQHLRETATAERERRKALHHMHCAKCGDTMTTTRLDGIEVEVCPECGGIYLDAGELDKLVAAKRGLFGEALGRLRSIWK